jgi:hypothetical protein
MEHLTPETLARLVDESSDAAEAEHLTRCATCRDELDAMIRQRNELALLPIDEIPSSELGWERIAVALREEGILRDAAVLASPVATGFPWMRVAAALVLFALGGTAGWGVRGGIARTPDLSSNESFAPVAVSSSGEGSGVVIGVTGSAAPEEGAPSEGLPAANVAERTVPALTENYDTGSRPVAREESAGTVAAATSPTQLPEGSDSATIGIATLLASPPVQFASLSEAEEMIQIAELLYFETLAGYRDFLAESGFEPDGDPVTRYVALGNVVAIAEEAVRSAPADPFLNGLLINTLVEREAVGRGMMRFAADW